jgi:hypothetical protein
MIKFGSYMNPVDHAVDTASPTHRNAVPIHETNTVERTERTVEWNYAKTARTIPEKVRMVDTLGIRICPGSNEYFDV